MVAPSKEQFIPKKVHSARVSTPRNTQSFQNSYSFAATKEILSLSRIIAIISLLSIIYRDNKCVFTCDITYSLLTYSMVQSPS